MSVELGDFKLGSGVLELIVGMAAVEVDGVAGLSGGVIESLSDWIKRGATKGVKITANEEKTVAVDVHILIDYGKVIPDVAKAVQKNVKKAVESMTSCSIGSIDVFVDGVAEPTQ